MTQEEKAKAYDEAIEKLRDFYRDYDTVSCLIDVKEELANIFPELVEGEDEKTRKALINFFSKGAEYDSSTNGIKDRNIIAWLEKQGESYTKRDVDNAYLKGISDAKNELEKQGEQNTLNYENISIQQKDFASQKNIPCYSIGDVLCDKSCTTLNKESQSNFEITDIRNGMYICDKCSFPISQQDEYELVAKRIEQENAWSEEDEKIALSIEQIFNCASLLNIVPDKIEKVKSWLKNLKDRVQPQPKQKWSEEDERMCQETIDWFEKKCFPYALENDNPARESIKWLKSLKQRCAWKPSDEQMKFLQKCIEAYNEVTFPTEVRVLSSLYNDLKKLKGE